MSELCRYLGQEQSRQGGEPVQRPWGTTVPGIFEDQPGGQCSWNRDYEGRVIGKIREVMGAKL